MVEIRRGSEAGTGGDKLPWLEPVEDEDDGDYSTYTDEPRGGYGGVMAAVLGVLVVIAAITAGVVWFRHHRAATADIGETIHPDPGPYKVKPATPGGLDANQTPVASGTSAGEDIDSTLDLNAVPEQPVATRAKPGAPAPLPAPAQQPVKPASPAPQQQPQQSLGQMPIPVKTPPPAPIVKPAPAPVVAKAPPEVKPVEKPKPAEKAKAVEKPPVAEKVEKVSGGGGGSIQLGAFSSEAKAKAVWKTLTGRFHYLSDMNPVILPVEANGNKLFRLRATGGSTAPSLACGQLAVAGETCAVVGK